MHFLHAPQYAIIRTSKCVLLKRSMIILRFLSCLQRIGRCWTIFSNVDKKKFTLQSYTLEYLSLTNICPLSSFHVLVLYPTLNRALCFNNVNNTNGVKRFVYCTWHKAKKLLALNFIQLIILVSHKIKIAYKFSDFKYYREWLPNYNLNLK